MSPLKNILILGALPESVSQALEKLRKILHPQRADFLS